MDQTLSHIRLESLARRVRGGTWRLETLHSEPHHLLVWVTRGQGRIMVLGRTRGFGAHNAIFLPAGTPFAMEYRAQNFAQVLEFPLHERLPLPEEAAHLRVRDVMEQGEMTGLLDGLQRELQSGRPGAAMAAHFHAGLVAVWLDRQVRAAPAETPGSAEALVAAYVELLERDHASGDGVAAYAERLGVTPTHLSRCCNTTCGRSAISLLTERLIHAARCALVETNAPLQDIARSLGFGSPAYFSRSFTQHTGLTPSAFRSRHRETG